MSCHVEKLDSVHTKCQYQVTVLEIAQAYAEFHANGVLNDEMR